MNTSKLNANDYMIMYRHQTGSKIKLSNAQRLLGVDLTVDHVVELYQSLSPQKRHNVLFRAGIEPKTFYRWKHGHNEPMYQNLLNLYRELQNENTV